MTLPVSISFVTCSNKGAIVAARQKAKDRLRANLASMLLNERVAP